MIAVVIDTLKLLAVQNIAIRGHRDDGKLFLQGGNVINSENDGNFRHFLRLRLENGDVKLKETFQSADRNATYTSKTIQNQLLFLMGEMITETIVRRANGSKIWALLADETTDRQTREILVLVCRYTYHEKGQIVIREDPFAIVDAFEKARTQNQSERNELKLDGKTLGHVILSQLRKATLDTSICVGQGYDGAATMAGVANGVAAEIKKTAPLADYFHCVSHATNLSCSKCITVPLVRNAQDTMSTTINHFTASAKRVSCLKKHAQDLGLDTGNLLSLCSTRFVERHTAVLRFLECFPAIMSALEDMETWDDRDASVKSHSIRVCLEKPENLIGLFCLRQISAVMKPLSQQLQKKRRRSDKSFAADQKKRNDPTRNATEQQKYIC